jgi:hypothetical protein
LILLTGSSGVGKTSLLGAGLIPELNEAGYYVAFCRGWGGRHGEADAAAFLASKLHEQFAERVPDLGTGADMFWDLERYLGGKCVIILDQFEELIRYAPALKELVFRLLLAINRETKLKIIVSFRAEYLHELKPLETDAQPFTISYFELKEIDEALAANVALAANKSGSDAIDKTTAKQLAIIWREARSSWIRAGGDRSYRVGLLHLQALLYSLHDLAGGKTVSEDTVAMFKHQAGESDFFLAALEQAVDVKLARCRRASADQNLDAYLIEGAAQDLARSVQHLSSAGYKLVREAADLASQAIGPELESLLLTGLPMAGAGKRPTVSGDGPLAPSQYETLFHAMTDAALAGQEDSGIALLDDDRWTIARQVDELVGPIQSASLEQRLHLNADARFADPAEVTCGPMFGMAPAAVLIEELRRFAFALAWLEETSLVRLTRPPGDAIMVSLIHDGFGAALERWSVGALAGPAGAMRAITAPRGAEFVWRGRHDDKLRGDGYPRVIPNLRWRGAWVKAAFSNVVFVNCDFRGSFFADCLFEEVTFINCLLDGVIFSDCVFDGDLVPATGEWDPMPPVFRVRTADPELPRVLARYRHTEAERDELYSPLPGLPAVPAGGALEREPTPWTPGGGLTIYGGRVSSLVLRGCHGPVALRHTAGSGFEVVEGSSGTFELFASALRHVAFTVDPGTHETADFHIRVVGSLLAHAWLGPNLTGAFHAADCRLLQIWCDSEAPEFSAKAVDSSTYGLYHVHESKCTALKPSPELSNDLRAMEYMRRPQTAIRLNSGTA